MDIEIELLPHQKKLMRSPKNIKGLACGRGAGKSYIMSLMIAIDLIHGKKCIVMAQGYKALSINLFSEICARLDLLKQKYEFNHGQMFVKCGKGIAYGATYENEDAVRGLTEVNSLYLDELCLAKSDLLAVVGPCLRGNFIPQIVFATSPRQGSFWNYWIKDESSKGNIDIFTATMMDNSFISKESIELSKNAITDPLLVRQEIYGEILDDEDGNQLVHMSDFAKKAVIDNYMWSIGIDCVGEGKDSGCIALRKGHMLYSLKRYPKLTGDEALTEVKKLCIEYGITEDNLNVIGIDMGYGEAVYERLSEYYNCRLIPFASKADSELYANKRAEMYFRLQKYMNDGMEGITDESLRQELLATRWELDKRDKIILIPKEEIKAVLRRSPDSADALALTFCDEDVVTDYHAEYLESGIDLGDPDD